MNSMQQVKKVQNDNFGDYTKIKLVNLFVRVS